MTDIEQDKAKLRALYKVFQGIDYPEMETEDGKDLVEDIQGAIKAFLEFFARAASKL